MRMNDCDGRPAGHEIAVTNGPAEFETRRRVAKGGFQGGQTAKARRGPPCAVTPERGI